MALVNPNIAMSFRMPEFQSRNALAEYAQIQQIQGGQRQAEVADMQLESLRRDRDVLGRIQAAIVAKGGPPDLAAAADEMIKSGKPEYMTQGAAIRQKLADQSAFAAYQSEFGPKAQNALAPAFGMPAGDQAPGDYTSTQTMGRVPGVVSTPIPESPPMNAMAPAPAAPVNAMASKPDVASLEARYRRVASIDTPGAKAEAALLLKQIEAASKESPLYTVPNVGLVDRTGRVIKPSVATPVAPTQLAKLQTERAALLPGDPRIAQYDALIRKETTHAPGVSITNKQEGAFESGLGKGQSERILANQVAAQDAAEILRTNQVGRDLLKAGAITGTGADFLVGFNNALKQVGVDFGYADAAANSQAYVATLGANVGRIIKQFGAGTGLSDADRDFAEKIAGGKIALTETALRKILDINDRASNRVIDLHNKNVAGIKTNIPLTVEKPNFGRPPAAASQIPTAATPARAAPAASAIPQGAIDALKAGRGTDAQFDEMFGPGAAKRARGGK